MSKRGISIISTLKKYLIPNLPYIGVGWLFNKIGEAYGLSTEDVVAFRLLETISNLNTTISSPIPSFALKDIIVGIIGAFGFYGIVAYKKSTAKNWRHDIEYGSARFGTLKDIEPYKDRIPDQNIILTATESLTMNSRPSNPKYARNKNVLVIGGSGSGKTRFFIKPNIMQLHSSYVITDPKGVRPDRA